MAFVSKSAGERVKTRETEVCQITVVWAGVRPVAFGTESWELNEWERAKTLAD